MIHYATEIVESQDDESYKGLLGKVQQKLKDMGKADWDCFQIIRSNTDTGWPRYELFFKNKIPNYSYIDLYEGGRGNAA